jgi:ribonuclease BN (tRNA processing enzyme)
LYLIHYDPQKQSVLLAEAQREFNGPVSMAEDFMVLGF